MNKVSKLTNKAKEASAAKFYTLIYGGLLITLEHGFITRSSNSQQWLILFFKSRPLSRSKEILQNLKPQLFGWVKMFDQMLLNYGFLVNLPNQVVNQAQISYRKTDTILTCR